MAASLPAGLRKPLSERLALVASAVSVGQMLNRQEQVVVGPDAIWALEQRRQIGVTNAEIAAWEAFVDSLDGGANSVVIVPGTDTAGGERYARPTEPGAEVAAAASQYADVVRVSNTGAAADWAPGMLFGLRGTCHRVVSATVIDADTVDLVVRPRLRRGVVVGDAIVAPSIVMRLVDLEGAQLTIGPGGVPDPVTLRLVEVPLEAEA